VPTPSAQTRSNESGARSSVTSWGCGESSREGKRRAWMILSCPSEVWLKLPALSVPIGLVPFHIAGPIMNHRLRGAHCGLHRIAVSPPSIATSSSAFMSPSDCVARRCLSNSAASVFCPQIARTTSNRATSPYAESRIARFQERACAAWSSSLLTRRRL
jgi:hypothetical protein